MKTLRFWLPWVVLIVATAHADSVLRDAGDLPLQLAEDAERSKVFIVQLREPSAAEHFAKATGKVARGDKRLRFDKNSNAMKAYADRLTVEQDKVLDADPAPGEGPIEDARKSFEYLAGL